MFWPILRFYTKNNPQNSWSPHFMITLWNQKSRNAGTSCSTYLGYITLGLAFSGLPSPSPSLFSAWFYLRLKDKMKISWPFSNQVSLTWLWTIWIDEYLKGKFIIDVRKLKRRDQQIRVHNRVILKIGNIQWRHINRERFCTL